MAKGMPSLMALLGLVAVAGYQNRDKLREMIGTTQPGGPERPDDQAGPAGSGGLLDEIGQMFGSGASGRNLSSGLGDLVERFRATGQGAKAELLGVDGSERRLAAGGAREGDRL